MKPHFRVDLETMDSNQPLESTENSLSQISGASVVTFGKKEEKNEGTHVYNYDNLEHRGNNHGSRF